MGGLMEDKRTNRQAGISLIEVLIAMVVLSMASLGVIGLVWTSILMNNRNKVDSTQTMLAQSIIEQVNSTIIGSETSALSDCAGTTWTISTTPGGAAVSNGVIDFTETSPPSNYHMNYVTNIPCDSTGTLQASYDVRWHVDIVGEAEGTPTNTYLVTVGARRTGSTDNNLIDSSPVNLRVMVGN
jgi:prepilin-type N-terminal cleavage/methylation domain-containing protein